MDLILRIGYFILLISLVTKCGNYVSAEETSTTTEGTSTTSRRPNRNLCVEGQTTVNGKRSCKGKIVFQELFNDLPSTKWRREVKFAGDPDYEFVLYRDNATNVYVSDNLLHIKPTLLENVYGAGFAKTSKGINLGVDCTGMHNTFDCVQTPRAWQILPPVISAQISTIDYFSFMYGTIEIRAKLPKGNWIYPEISLVSRSDLYGPGYESGRIRIALLGGNSEYSYNLLGGCVLGYSEIARSVQIKQIRSSNSWSDDYHTFKVQWKPEGITVSVDNQIYGTITPTSGGFASEQEFLGIDPLVAERWEKGSLLAPFDHEMYVLLGVGVGGQVFLDSYVKSKPWNSADPKAQLHFYRSINEWIDTWNEESELLVDYVKVWAA